MVTTQHQTGRSITPGQSKLDSALAWAARGFPVFAINANGKTPLCGSRGFHDATLDPEQIRKMWTDPVTGALLDRNIACCPPPGVVVADLDEKSGRNGVANYEALGGLVEGLVVSTPTGGLHLYLRGHGVATSAGRIAEGVDTRGQDAYAVCPGSTIDGVAYELIQDGAMLQAPAFLAERAPIRDRMTTKSTYAVEDDLPRNVARFVEVCQRAEGACGGIWHAASRDLACEAVRLAVSVEAAIAVMLKHWVPKGTGFHEDERDQRWAADVEGSYAWALGFGEHGMHAAPDLSIFNGLVITPPPDDNAALSIAEPAQPQAPRSTLRLLSMAECRNAPRRTYVVKGLMSAGDVAYIVGEPGAGKSIIAPHIAYAVATGGMVFGRRTRAGKVIYAPTEDKHGIMARVGALGSRHGDSPNLTVVDGVPDLRGPDGQADDFLALVRAEKPAMVCFDTLHAGWPGADENSSIDMGLVAAYLRQLATAGDGTPGPCVVVMHHPPKGGRGLRGHGSLNGAADVVVLLEKDEKSGIVSATLSKNRSGPSVGVAMAFVIASQPTGVDEDGDMETAPVAVETEAKDRSRAGELTVTEQNYLGVLRDLLADGGPDVVRGTKVNVHGLELADRLGIKDELWKVACENRLLSTAKDKKSRAKQYNRIHGSLEAKGAIKVVFDVVFMEAGEVE